ncbi:MAG: T9SS type A sorting domain-containing protein, partial [Bacteroidia bacterium]|nr:T9SS type A sorting domain-containing protein [Bacteroidia bacterium]
LITSEFYFFPKNTDGTGGASTINCRVWDDNGAGGIPSTAFTPSVSLAISALDITGTGNIVTFSPPINPASGGFYVGFDGLVYNGTTGTFDTVAILTNADGESAPVTAWEQWSDNSWHSFNDGTSATWQLDLSLCIAVVMCSPTTDVPYIINPTNEVIVYPNPANNILYVNTNSKKEGTITIKLLNVMGQLVSTKTIANSTGGTFDIDLSNVSAGVYFVNVSTPEKTVTKRFVVDK